MPENFVRSDGQLEVKPVEGDERFATASLGDPAVQNDLSHAPYVIGMVMGVEHARGRCAECEDQKDCPRHQFFHRRPRLIPGTLSQLLLEVNSRVR